MSRSEAEDEQRRRSKLEEALEIKSLRRIISAYVDYSDAAEEDVRRYERSFAKLPPSHKALLSQYPIKCQRIRRCISANSYFILSMLQAFEPPIDMSHEFDVYEHETMEIVPESHCSGPCASTSGRTSFSDQEAPMVSKSVESSGSLCPKTSNRTNDVSNDVRVISNHAALDSVPSSNQTENLPSHDWLNPSFQLRVPLADVDKVRCIIRNIVRDWAPEGWKERDECYTPILEELDRLFPNRSKDRPPCCLVPGAGLGRLALEISCLGFISQGNEFSYYMMICSSFILNHTQNTHEWTIYPWIHSNCNSLSDNDQLRAVSFPDIHPASAGITEGFSMCGGDFIEVYNDSSQEGMWDAVVTCFFIDTAHNIVEYIEIISRILRNGGVWINFGPLLYHFADAYGTEDEMSIELSLEDVKRIAFHYGFHMEQEKTVETTYTANPRSMMQNRYYAAFWTMRKK